MDFWAKITHSLALSVELRQISLELEQKSSNSVQILGCEIRKLEPPQRKQSLALIMLSFSGSWYLQSRSISLNEDQEKIVRAKEALDAEREALKGDTRTLANLRSEHARLKEDFRSLFTGNCSWWLILEIQNLF